jgi:copper homeostasis protein
LVFKGKEHIHTWTNDKAKKKVPKFCPLGICRRLNMFIFARSRLGNIKLVKRPLLMKDYLLEICCDHLESALAAQEGGAHRIELCAALATDGITPSAGLLAMLTRRLSIPVFVLVRPRPGNFVYNERELETMLFDIHQCKALGASGIVSGALRSDHTIDREATATLIAAAAPLPFTFHKAFDLTPDPFAALDTLIELGAARVLTSGQMPKAVDGKTVLAQLVQRGRDRITILCGGGVRDHNLGELMTVPDLVEFHSSALLPQNKETAYPTVNKGMVSRMLTACRRPR